MTLIRAGSVLFEIQIRIERVHTHLLVLVGAFQYFKTEKKDWRWVCSCWVDWVKARPFEDTASRQG